VDVTIRENGRPPVGARLYYNKETALEPGDVIVFTANFKRTDGISDGERFDPLSSRGAFLSAFVTGNIEITGHERGISSLPLALSRRIADMAAEIFPDDVSPFMQALIIGNQDELNRDPGLSSALSASGIIHVVAISGTHVAFLMGFLGIVIKNKRLLAFLGVPVLLLFMAMTGFTPSVSRSVIMQIFLICAPIWRRESDGITSLSASMLVLLAVNPYACASVGLQLSFSATLGIILFTTRINAGVTDRLRGMKIYKRKLPKAIIIFVVCSLSTTVGALVFTMPLTVIHFGYVSLIAPVTNLLTLWAVSLAFPLGLAVCILGFIYAPLAAIAAYPVVLAVRYLIFTAQTLASVPYSVIYSANSHIIFWLVYIYIIFITLPLMRARPRQYIYPACIAIVLLVAVILAFPFLPGAGDSSVTVLDVGQGLSTVMTSGRHTAVVDCGSISGENAGAVTHGFLLNDARTEIDLLILTHFHEDHINGVEFLLGRISVGALAIPDPEGSFLAEDIIELARKQGTDIIYVTETMRVTLGEMEIIIYPPMGSGDQNERGLAILALGGVSALITGDMNSQIERSLLRSIDLPKVDLLVVGHHGSKNSTSDELLAAIAPDIAVISVGYNTFGHPASETLERLRNHSVTIYRTDEAGNVTIRGR